MKYCEIYDCGKQAIYNYPGLKVKFCGKHKLQDMINVKNPSCKEILCKNKPLYNYERETKPMFCLNHKKDNMVNIVIKRCKYPKCIKKFISTNGYCLKHLVWNQQLKINDPYLCISPGCCTSATYNYSYSKVPIYCWKHKRLHMRNFINEICIAPNCTKTPTFNLPTEDYPIYCLAHKTDQMVDVKHKKCTKCGLRVYSIKSSLCQKCTNQKLIEMAVYNEEEIHPLVAGPPMNLLFDYEITDIIQAINENNY